MNKILNKQNVYRWRYFGEFSSHKESLLVKHSKLDEKQIFHDKQFEHKAKAEVRTKHNTISIRKKAGYA